MATPTSNLGFQNFFQASLTGDITATSTDILMDAIPNASEGFLVIEPDSTSAREVIFYNSKTALKVVCPSVAEGRGQDDTTAGAHSTGATVIMAPVAGFFEALQSGAAFTAGAIGTSDLADTSVTNAKLATGAGEPGGAWTSYTPTLSGRLNDSKWTKTCSYKQVGKTVFYKISLVANNPTPMDGGTAEAIISLPVTCINWGSPINIGNVRVLDSGTAAYYGHAEWASTTTINVRISNAAGTYITPTVVTSAVPFAWTTSDEIQIIGFYEAA